LMEARTKNLTDERKEAERPHTSFPKGLYRPARMDFYMKKTLLSLLLLFSLLLLTGCGTVGSESESVIEGSLEELLAKVTEGVEPDIMVMETPLTQENFSSYLFIDYVEGSEGLASDAAINAIAHSVVLLRLPEGADAAEIQKEIEENLNPRKWVCVEAESSKVARHGNLILVAMSSKDAVNKAVSNFDALSK
jgi:hypothetical protein